MADRIIKGDSGNDVVIQNNAGSRKIEVTNSGDVEVTGDFKATTVKATNLKANDGTAGLVVADSTGEVTSSGGLKATNVKTTNLKANDGTAGLVIADSTGRISVSEKIETDDILEKTSAHGVEIDGLLIKDSSIASGSIADAVTQPDAYYVQGKLDSTTDLSSTGEMLNLTGTTDPHIVWTGSTSSFSIGSTTTHDFKFTKKGIYFVSFNVSARAATSNQHEVVHVQVRGTGSESSNILSASICGIANISDLRTDFGYASSQLVKEFAVNDMINFFIDSENFEGVRAGVETHITIFLIRATA